MSGPQSPRDACGNQSAAGLLGSSASHPDSDGLLHALPDRRFCSGTRPRAWWVRRRPHGWWTLRWRPRRQLRWTFCRSSVRGRALRRGSLRRPVRRRSLHRRFPGTIPPPVLLPRLPPLSSRAVLLPPPSRIFRLLRVRLSSCRAVLRLPAVQLLLRPVLRSALPLLSIAPTKRRSSRNPHYPTLTVSNLQSHFPDIQVTRKVKDMVPAGKVDVWSVTGHAGDQILARVR